MNKDPLAVLDEQGRVVIANTALCRLLDLSMQKIEGIDIFSLDKADLRSTDLQSKLQSALKADKDFETNPFQLDTEQGRKTISLKGQVVHQGKKERPYRVLLQFVNR
jgi:PAS domain-containing protein